MLPLVVGCKKDEKNADLSAEALSQTIWNGNITQYDSWNHPFGEVSFILEFVSDTEGNYIVPDQYPIKRFQYSVNESILSFIGSYPTSGEWYITKSSKNQITLLSYRSDKTIMTLERIY